jgi:hypothetical protein
VQSCQGAAEHVPSVIVSDDEYQASSRVSHDSILCRYLDLEVFSPAAISTHKLLGIKVMLTGSKPLAIVLREVFNGSVPDAVPEIE